MALKHLITLINIDKSYDSVNKNLFKNFISFSFSPTSKLERLPQFIRSSNLGLITTPNNSDLFLFTFFNIYYSFRFLKHFLVSQFIDLSLRF